MTDFDSIFRSGGLEPLPDVELKEAMTHVLAFMEEDDLAEYISVVQKFDSRPVHVTETHDGEYLIKMQAERVVYWWHLRQDLAVIPRFMMAAQDNGLSYEESVGLLRNVAKSNKYDFGDVHGIIEATAEIMEHVSSRGKSLTSSAPMFEAFLAKVRDEGESDRAFGIVRLGVIAGMSIEQAIDIVHAIYDGYGIAGYVFRSLYDELDALGANAAGGDLIYQAVKAAHASRLDFSDFSYLLYAASTQTGACQAEILKQFCDAIAPTDASAGLITGASANLSEPSNDPFERVAQVLLPQASGKSTVVKPEIDYFPRIQSKKLVHGILPYQLSRTLDDGLADLRELMLSSGVEGMWVFDPDRETWFSLGGRTKIKVGGARHEFVPYDISMLSDRPVLVHIHPKNNEIFIAPDRASLSFPQMQTKLVSFLTAMPSGADFEMLSALARASSRQVDVTGLIVSSVGITSFSVPSDALDQGTFTESFKYLKGDVMLEFDAQSYLHDHGISEPDFAFVQRLIPEVREKLPQGYEVNVARHEDFELEPKASTSLQLPVAGR